MRARNPDTDKHPTPVPDRARLGAELELLYADGKFPELLAQMDALSRDAARSFIAKEERSDVVHDLLAFLAERMLEMNKQEASQEIRLSWAGELHRGQGR